MLKKQPVEWTQGSLHWVTSESKTEKLKMERTNHESSKRKLHIMYRGIMILMAHFLSEHSKEPEER